MRINNSLFRKKCLSEKYYSSIKYMSHALKGKDRRNFIRRVCDINIFLGCQCAITCEPDSVIEKYINKRIHSYFKPQEVYYYDKKEQQKKKAVRRLRNFDIANFLLACNLMGYRKTLNWYIYNHSVQKSILIQLAAEMNENQLLDFMLTLSRSDLNKDKMRGIGSTKNLFQKKNDRRVKEILSTMWDVDKDAYVQFAYDTGLLEELWKTSKNGKSIYIHILNKSVKQKLTLEYLEDALGEDELVSILQKSVVGKNFLYLVYLERLQRGIRLSEQEYDAIKSMSVPPEKIRNYYIPFFLKLKNNATYMENLDYSRVYECFGKLYVPLDKVNVKVGKTNSKKMSYILRHTASERWKKIVELYFKTCLSETNSFDDLFRQLNRFHDIQLQDFINEAKRYSLKAEFRDKKLKFIRVRTENYIILTNYESLTEGDIVVKICDYDYIEKQVYVMTV